MDNIPLLLSNRLTGTVRGVGNYSRLACEFYFVRSLGYYIIHIYVPSCLIVVLSWISFWLHRDASPARVSLGITTVLTMTTILSSSNASLPKISYLKSIDIFLVTCFIMVFASLLEYACVSFLGLVRPATTMMKAGRQQQQQLLQPPPQRYHHRYQTQQAVRQSRDYLLDSPWDSAVFVTGETRTTDNGSTSQHGSVPPVVSSVSLSALIGVAFNFSQLSVGVKAPWTSRPSSMGVRRDLYWYLLTIVLLANFP